MCFDLSQTKIDSWKLKVVRLLKKDKDCLYFDINNIKFNINIPDESDGCFFLEVLPGYKAYWLSRINEFILEKQPNLERILKHVERQYLKNSKLKDDMSDDFELNDSQINNFDIVEQQYKKKLEERISIMKSKLSLNTDSNKAPVLFSGNIPANILLNEFFTLRTKFKKDNKININLIEENIFHWSIKFKNFSNDRLTNNLRELEKKYGYNYIDLEVLFHDKLYPSYPPFLKPIRPKLEDGLMHRITCLTMVQFEYWTPTRNMEYVLNKLYEVINKHCTIDYTSEMNDIKKYPNGAYHNLEALLIKLASLCDIKDVSFQSLDDTKYIQIISSHKKNTLISTTTTNKSKTPQIKSAVWKSGTGYGTGGSTSWDPTEYVRLQEEKDKQMQAVLNEVIENIQSCEGHELIDICKIVKSSYLLSYLQNTLKCTTIFEMSKHTQLYKLFFTLLQTFAIDDAIYLFDYKKSDKNLYEILELLYREAINIKKFNVKDETEEEDFTDIDITYIVISLFEMIKPIYVQYILNKEKLQEDVKKNWDKRMELAKININSVNEQYQTEMEEFKFDTINFNNFSKFQKNIGENSINKNIMRRIAKEYGSLMNNLPIYYESSIFVRVNNQNNRQIKVLITGPNNTPYDSGIFIFDVLIGDTYPNGPPTMKFVNTGGKRFNPNLYIDGKVCLSLLGTWSGTGGEQWNSLTSTLYQLFISVQAQILIENPFFNEPGYEKMNNDTGQKQSQDYNNDIRYYTMCHAIGDILEKPENYSEFLPVIEKHFSLKKEYILTTCEKWYKEAYGDGKNSLMQKFQDIQNLLSKY